MSRCLIVNVLVCIQTGMFSLYTNIYNHHHVDDLGAHIHTCTNIPIHFHNPAKLFSSKFRCCSALCAPLYLLSLSLPHRRLSILNSVRCLIIVTTVIISFDCSSSYLFLCKLIDHIFCSRSKL